MRRCLWHPIEPHRVTHADGANIAVWGVTIIVGTGTKCFAACHQLHMRLNSNDSFVLRVALVGGCCDCCWCCSGGAVVSTVEVAQTGQMRQKCWDIGWMEQHTAPISA
jgi:hypothetical protein